MKKSIFFMITFLLINYVCWNNLAASEKSKNSALQSKIEGIGNLKIGKTILNDELVEDFKDRFATFSKSDDIPDLVHYKIPHYYSEVIDMKIGDIKLDFYKGVLFYIRCDSHELLEAFKLKYGIPTVHRVTKNVQCLFKLTGNIVTFQEKEETITWENGNIIASYYKSNTIDHKCQSDTYSSLSIYDKKIFKMINKTEEALRFRKGKDGKKEQLEKLKGL